MCSVENVLRRLSNWTNFLIYSFFSRRKEKKSFCNFPQYDASCLHNLSHFMYYIFPLSINSAIHSVVIYYMCFILIFYKYSEVRINNGFLFSFLGGVGVS